MCLILFAVNPNDRYSLVVAANRDELYARPTDAARFWDEQPALLGGRDMDAGGTWLGVNQQGYFSAVTNFREEPHTTLPPESRGDLPTAFLTERPDPASYLSEIQARSHQYKGFNLLVADQKSCHYYGNRAGAPSLLTSGYYGLSNQLLNCDWPKVTDGRSRLKDILKQSNMSKTGHDDLAASLFEVLLGSGDDREFSNAFIQADRYGTRAATVVLIEHSGDVYFEERNFIELGEPGPANQYQFTRTDDS
jgi:uncharacterized protein with NRDE domain